MLHLCIDKVGKDVHDKLNNTGSSLRGRFMGNLTFFAYLYFLTFPREHILLVSQKLISLERKK